VTLPTAATEALSEHLGRFVGPGPEDLVFTSPQGLQLRATTWRRRFFDPAVRAAGLEPLRPHDLGHTAVALWIASGDNVKAISTRAGHSSVAFTLDTYGHLMPDSEQLHRSRLDELIAVARRGQLADGVVRSLRG
jgi:integrase